MLAAFASLLVLVAMLALVLYLLARPNMGRAPADTRLARIEHSPQWRDGRFRNRLKRIDAPPGRMMREFLFGGSDDRFPSAPVPVVPHGAADYRSAPASGLRVTWFGHSTLLLEIDGHRVLFDPMWGTRASPLSFVGPRRYYAPSLALSDLPPIDAVMISHDHYDHLDVSTVQRLAQRRVRWLVPLGIGARLASWGVPDSLITELDWWENARIGDLTITATPSRHFSGRGLDDQDKTLWAGWSVAGPTHRAFYSGDTALHDEFVQIGERLGPFDLTMIECGEYSALWADVHLGPEQAVLAHRLVRGKVMLPVHWAGFDLALHGWTEPIERVLVAARKEGVDVATPRPGEMLEPSTAPPVNRWWPAIPWETVEQAPAWSSEVSHLRASMRDSTR